MKNSWLSEYMNIYGYQSLFDLKVVQVTQRSKIYCSEADEDEIASTVLDYVPWPMNTTSYQNRLEICTLNFKTKGRSEIAFLNTT